MHYTSFHQSVAGDTAYLPGLRFHTALALE